MKVCPHCGRQYPDSMTLCSADATALRSVADQLLGRTLAGKYRIEQQIKSGGMGAVYRGKHVLMEKTVAIKVLRPSLAADEKVVERFTREAKAASRISHPHAVSVTDFGEAENGVVFLVMEYLDGRTLKDVIRSQGRMPLTRAVEIIRQVASALDAAHEQGVVHRDLKSENVLLMRTGGKDWAKVLDFGIAKILGRQDPGLTAPNLIIGTPQYMSPEQCSEGQAIDARSDIYSLGVILFEMLAGRLPFTGESATAIMLKHAQEPPPSLLAARPDLPRRIGDVVARALAKKPENRFQTAGDLAAALARAAAGNLAEPAIHGSQTATQIGAGTVPHEPAIRAADRLDEGTVVRPPIPPVGGRTAPAAVTAALSFNPWRVVVPSAVALLVVFAIVYAFTRSAEQTQNQQMQSQPGLAVDPNSQAVQPSGTPTGEAEQDIHPTSEASPAGGGLSTNTNINANFNANASQNRPVPSPRNPNLNQNEGEGRKPNINANRAPELPSPKPSPSVKATPTPQELKPSPQASPAQPAGSPPV